MRSVRSVLSIGSAVPVESVVLVRLVGSVASIESVLPVVPLWSNRSVVPVSSVRSIVSVVLVGSATPATFALTPFPIGKIEFVEENAELNAYAVNTLEPLPVLAALAVWAALTATLALMACAIGIT